MYTTHDISLGTSSTITIGNIVNINANSAATLIKQYASGGTSPSAHYIGESSPAVTFQTTGLGTLLGIGTSTMISAGLCLASDISTFPFRELVGCGTGSASHQSLTTANCFTYITSISAQLGQDVTADCETKFISTDGLTTPVTVNSGASLSSAALLPTYVLAEVYIDGVQVTEVTGVTITPGFTLVEQRQGTGNFVTSIIAKVETATIEITTQNIAQANALFNGAATSTGVDIYLAKRAEGAGRTELYTAEEHIKISSTAGTKQTQTIQTTREDGSGTIKIDLQLPSSGTQVCLAATVDVAISA